MIFLGNFVGALGLVVYAVLTIYMYIIIARAIISWVNPDPYNPLVKFLYHTTEPVLSRIRKRLPYMGGVDLSPMIVLLVIIFLRYFLNHSFDDLRTILDTRYRMPQ